MEIKINDITRQQIKALAIKYLHIIGEDPFDNVTPLDGDNDEMRSIAASALGVSSETFKSLSFAASEDGLYGFNDVGMHTDSINPKGAVALLIPVIGRGTFYHYGLKMKSYERVIDTRFSMADPRPVIFNDRLPHNFIATMNCAALLFAIRAKKLSEISLDIIP